MGNVLLIVLVTLQLCSCSALKMYKTPNGFVQLLVPRDRLAADREAQGGALDAGHGLGALPRDRDGRGRGVRRLRLGDEHRQQPDHGDRHEAGKHAPTDEK